MLRILQSLLVVSSLLALAFVAAKANHAPRCPTPMVSRPRSARRLARTARRFVAAHTPLPPHFTTA